MNIKILLDYCDNIRKDTNLFIYKSNDYVHLKFIRLIKGIDNPKYLIKLSDINVYGVVELDVTLKISDLKK